MKKTALIFTIILIPVDFLMLVLAALSSYDLRVGSFVTEIRPVIYTLSFGQFLTYSLLIAFGCLFIFSLAGLYRIQTSRNFVREFSKIFLACSTAVLAIIVAIFLKRELFSSRFIILAAWGFAVLYVTIGRLIVYKIQKIYLKIGYGAKKVIIIGQEKNVQIIAKEIKSKPELGYKIIQTFQTFGPEIEQQIIELNKKESLDEIILLDPNLDKEKVSQIITFTDTYHLTFKFSADLFGTKSSRLNIDTIIGVPIFELKKTKLEGWGRIYKRIFDLVGALFFILLFSPILIITALAIKLTGPGPIIYKNTRVGQNDKEFAIFKFRSMDYKLSTGVGTVEEQAKNLALEQELISKQNVREGAVYKIKDDPRITTVGKFIRKWSIDEMPQFFNVLFGQMSLVGPRPHQPREVANYTKEQLRTLDIKPGVTGLAQTSGRSDLNFDEEAKLDIYYIENWSLWLDLQILLKTPLVVLAPHRKAL